MSSSEGMIIERHRALLAVEGESLVVNRSRECCYIYQSLRNNHKQNDNKTMSKIQYERRKVGVSYL